jgi:hypothetical protein
MVLSMKKHEVPHQNFADSFEVLEVEQAIFPLQKQSLLVSVTNSVSAKILKMILASGVLTQANISSRKDFFLLLSFIEKGEDIFVRMSRLWLRERHRKWTMFLMDNLFHIDVFFLCISISIPSFLLYEFCTR